MSSIVEIYENFAITFTQLNVKNLLIDKKVLDKFVVDFLRSICYGGQK